jgi:hypothetical protein
VIRLATDREFLAAFETIERGHEHCLRKSDWERERSLAAYK